MARDQGGQEVNIQRSSRNDSLRKMHPNAGGELIFKEYIGDDVFRFRRNRERIQQERLNPTF